MRWRDLLILIEFPFQTYLEDMKIWIGFVFLLNWWQIIPKSNMFKALQFSLWFYNIMFIFWMHIQFLDLLIIDLVSFAFVMCLFVQGMKRKGKNSCCYSFHDINRNQAADKIFLNIFLDGYDSRLLMLLAHLQSQHSLHLYDVSLLVYSTLKETARRLLCNCSISTCLLLDSKFSSALDLK